MTERPRHTCHWPGCAIAVDPQFFACRRHWYMLPKAIRMDIWRYYRKGQEVTKDPSADYIAATRRAREWIYDHHPPQLHLQLGVAQ